LKIKKVPEPHIKDDQVLIQIKNCGICGSNIHMCESKEDGYINYFRYTKFPIIIGHEFSGIVVERGSKVKDLDVGDIIVGDDMIRISKPLQKCRGIWFYVK